MANHAREVGGHVLSKTTFNERAALLKALAQYLNESRETLYELSYDTGATKADAMIDIMVASRRFSSTRRKAGESCPTT